MDIKLIIALWSLLLSICTLVLQTYFNFYLRRRLELVEKQVQWLEEKVDFMK